jgi:signal transduction histidine kinase
VNISRGSIFRRLIVTYIGIMLLTILILMVFMSRLFSSAVYSQRADSLLERAQQVVELYGEAQEGSLGRAAVARVVVHMARTEQINAVVVDRNGKVMLPRLADQRNLPRDFIAETLPEVLEGENVRNIPPVSLRQRVSFLTVGTPLTLNGEAVGAVYTSTPVRVIRQVPQPVRRVMWIVIGCISLVAAVVIYFVSRRIADPLEEISEGALAIAEGNFDERVPVTGNDELAVVARSFNHMASQLQKLEELRRDFIANVSHELRTPLTSLKGFVQGLRDGTIPAQQRERYLGMVLQELNRLNRLISELLELASLDAGSLELQTEPRNAFELTRRSLVKLEPLLTKKKLDARVEFPEEPGTALLDVDRFDQIMQNLLSNAVQHTPEGGTIELNGALRESEVEVTVSDSGQGIPDEALPHIWDRFYKADRARVSGDDNEGSGTGLGLTITKQLVEAHGGSIRVESTAGEGATFVLTFPRLRKNSTHQD